MRHLHIIDNIATRFKSSSPTTRRELRRFLHIEAMSRQKEARSRDYALLYKFMSTL